MKTRVHVIAILLMINFIGFSQIQPFGHLTIFSEDGDKFVLILNGERMNDEPQTNLRVEELVNPHYNAKIIFENEDLKPISKNFLQIADVDGIMSDVTYKVRRNKNKKGKMKLSYFSSVPVVEGFIVPPNVYVTRYGHPAPPVNEVVILEEGTVTQTTTTSSSIGIGANVNLPGVNVNVSVNDPLAATTVTETTTIITNDGFADSDEYIEEHSDNYQGRSNKCKNKMWQQDYKDALASIKSINYDQTKLETAKQIITGNCMSAIQIKHICDLFGYEASKLSFAKYAFDYCTEPNNYFKIHKTFNANRSIDELNEYIQNR